MLKKIRWIIQIFKHLILASLLAQMVKNQPAVQETWVRSLSWKDPLENGMATHSSMPGEFHGQRTLVDYSPWGHKESYTTEWLTHLRIWLVLITPMGLIYPFKMQESLSKYLPRSSYYFLVCLEGPRPIPWI